VHPRTHSKQQESDTATPASNGRKPRRDHGTHQKLLVSAAEVFRRKGWHGATVDDIIKEAGVSRGSFYVYFENKQDVFERIIAPILDILFEEAGRRRPGSTIFARLEAGNRTFLEAWRRDPGLMRITFETNLDVQTNVSVAEMRRRFIERSANALRRHVAEGITHEGIDPDFAAGALAGMVTDFARERWFTGRSSEEPEDVLSLSYQLSALWYRAVYSAAAPPVPSEAEYRAQLKAQEEATPLVAAGPD